MEGGRLTKGALIKFFFMIVEVTDPRRLSRLENGLVGKFTVLTKSAAIGQKLKEQLMHIKELCKHMEMETTVRDVTEKKLFSYMNSDASAVEALKIRNKVTIETGFPCIITV